MISLFILSMLCVHFSTFFPREGDLLFQDIDCGALCDAIEEVTTGIHGAKLSHIGLVVSYDGKLCVLEAVSEGVVCTSVEDFLNRSKDKEGRPKVMVGRLKKQYQFLIPAAVTYATQYLGEVYDTVYSMSNEAWYCSELIYQSFRAAAHEEFFELTSMTFKSPESDSIFSAWQEYYDKMGMMVPEGEPGINPGSISRSDKIEIVNIYGIPEDYTPE